MNETHTETVLAPGLVPLALVAIETGEHIDALVGRFAADLVLDDVGMRAVPAAVVRRFFTERAEWEARQEEERRARAGKRRKHTVPTGLPAKEGLTAFETIMASGDYQSVADAFGRPRPDFLAEELEAGQRAAREKAQLVKKMKEDLQ